MHLAEVTIRGLTKGVSPRNRLHAAGGVSSKVGSITLHTPVETIVTSHTAV